MQFYSIQEYSHKEFGHTVKEIFDFVFLESVTRLLLRTFPTTVNSIAVIWVKTNVNRGLNFYSWNATLVLTLPAWCTKVSRQPPQKGRVDPDRITNLADSLDIIFLNLYLTKSLSFKKKHPLEP